MGKTGALVTASLEFGAILSNESTLPFQAIGEKLGLAFQIVDDLLDGDGLAEHLGTDTAQEMANRLHTEASTLIEQLPVKTEKLEDLASLLLFRTV